MNRYADAIKIIGHDDVDFKKLCFDIAAHNPGSIVAAAKRLNFNVTPAWLYMCRDLAKTNKIGAIKLYRENISCSLKEAKEAVDNF